MSSPQLLPIETMPALMPESRAAKELGVSSVTMRRIVKRGEIHYRLVGKRRKFSPFDLLEYLENQKTCQANGFVKSAASGSQNESVAPSGKSPGLTRPLDKQDGLQLARAILRKRKFG